MHPLRSMGAAVAVASLALIPASVWAVAPTPRAVAIDIKNFSFHDMDVTIPIGGTVTWKNLDGEPHTITSTDGVFRSGALDEGQSFSFKFSRRGVYSYICSIHPQMRARVTVR